MKIILMGYRGSGKTSVGQLLGRKLGLNYVDVDDVCCQRFGMDSVAEIWAAHGEPAWRAMECQVTADLCSAFGGGVIGLGGGTLMQPAARRAVEDAAGHRFYLWAPAEVLHARITTDLRSARTRPALTRQGGGLEEVQAVLVERDPVYQAVADARIDVSRKTVEEAADEILLRLNEKLTASAETSVRETGLPQKRFQAPGVRSSE